MSDQVEKLAFEPFGTLDGVLRGDPIRIFPVGKFYRDERTLDVTAARLKQFAANIKNGLPRFEIPINIEHDHQLGRYGSVSDLEYQEQGLDGPGLYATRYALTQEGRQLMEAGKFKGVSGEAVWTLFDGAKYQDPNTGAKHDNVLVGLALTNTPFFGKEVNMYSAFADQFTDYSADQRREMAKKGEALPDGSYPIANKGDLQNAIHAVGRGGAPHASIQAHIKKRAKALGAEDSLPAEWNSAGAEAEALRHNGFTKLRESMRARFQEMLDALMPSDAGGDDSDGADESDDSSADPENTEVLTAAAEAAQEQEHIMAEKPEQFTLTAEQFAALQAKADKTDKLETQVAQSNTELAALRTQSDAFATELAASKRARRLDLITARVDQFVALPGKTSELAANLLALEEKAPEQYAYFLSALEAADSALAQGELFSQRGSERQGAAEEATLESLADKMVAEKFNGDQDKYADALILVAKAHPELAPGHVPSTAARRGSR